MANLNKVMLIGRLTRDPEIRTFNNGGKVAAFGFAVNNKKKDPSGQWVDDPVFVDVDAYNRDNGRKLADLVEQYLKKGHQTYLEGSLKLDQWTDKEGQKRSKLKLVLHDMQFLEPKSDGGNSSGEGMARAPRPAAAPQRQMNNGGGNYNEEPDAPSPGGNGGQEEEIPF
jgi:single-strand DNA-binding protein